MKLSIVMPCLNEEDTLAVCIKKAKSYLIKNKVEGEVIIADNGSSDASVEIAINAGAHVVNVTAKGYGAALQGGIEAAKGKYIIMGDADDSYDFLNLNAFIEKLDEGNDLVMGNRFRGGIKKGAMPFLHRYLGNPVLSFIGRLFFRSPIRDFHCGLRGFTKEAYKKMALKSTGMEFASEMVVKATMLDMKIAEVPTILYPDGRSKPPHLNTWHDGWRHLRFLFLYAPNWLILFPGLLFFIIGITLGIALMFKPIVISNISLDIHTLLYMMAFAIVGSQLLILYVIVKNFSAHNNIIPVNELKNRHWLYSIKLENGIIAGALFFLSGFTLSLFNYLNWSDLNFGELNPLITMRKVIPSVFLLSIGIQLIIGSFVNTLLKTKE